MVKTFKARYSKGVIEPLEPLDCEEGKELIVTIEELTPLSVLRFEQAAGSWAGIIETEEFLRDIYMARSLSRSEVAL